MENKVRDWPRRLAIIAGVSAVGLFTGGAYWLGTQQSSQTVAPVSTQTDSLPITETSKETHVVDETILPTDGVTWYSEWKELAPAPELFVKADSNNPEFTEEYARDYSVYAAGEFEGDRLLVAAVEPNGPDYRGTRTPFLFRERADGKYTHLLRVTSTESQYYGPKLTSKVTVDSTTTFSSITPPDSVSINSVAVPLITELNAIYDELIKKSDHVFTKVADTASGSIYRERVVSETKGGKAGLGLERFILNLPNRLVQVYQFYPSSILKDDYSMKVTWNDGTSTTRTYRLDGVSGCGSPSSVTVWEGNEDALTKIGKTGNDEDIYGFKSSADPVISYYFEMTGGRRYDATSDKEVSFNLDDYVNHHGVIAYKDALGRFLILNSDEFANAAECGKPVVYLYPTQNAQVSVKVGAKVTVSEPAYNDGWQVSAEPTGKLTLADGRQYDSLFWEGLGDGMYPAITSGFVVPQAKLNATLWQQLKQLGLNENESRDFMDFWWPRMPKTPFVRLTWFGTRQMNELAPLTVTPQPDTMIRIFLDFAGLEQPINLASQRLSAPERKGFTLVEWGGLLKK